MMLARLTLTARLTVLFTGVAASVLLGLGIVVSWATARHFVELDRLYLADKMHLVEKLVTEAEQPAVLAEALNELLDSHPGLYVQVWQDSDLLYGRADLTARVAPATWVAREVQEWAYHGQVLRGFVERLKGADTRPNLWVLAAVDTVHHAHFLASMRQTLALYLLGAAVLCGVLAWWAAHRGLAPLKVMRERAMSITAHNLQQRMPAASVPVELADLATSLNGMFDRLQHDFQRLMDFSSDLAHELRTPLSNLLTQTQVALTQHRSAEEYREVLASNAEEFERLARMVSDMLFLAKTENGIDLPHRERIQLHQEVRALFDFYEAVAEEKNTRLVLQGQADIDGDRLMIRRAISNLLSNAIRHANVGSVVEVHLSRQGEAAGLTTRLDVVNHGPTIAPDHIPRLFERFYRADRSRAHPACEGAGLGLAITQAIVHAHGGQMEVASAAGRTCFSAVFLIAKGDV
jgi:two-component system, OmpR family, heavy metal sensor histidine kinase CusS